MTSYRYAIRGYVFAWNPENDKPWLVRIDGIEYVPLFPTQEKLEPCMEWLGIKDYTLKAVDDSHGFLASLAESGLTACVNLRPGENGKLRFAALRIMPA